VIEGRRGRSLFLQAVAVDKSIPIDQAAVDLWLKDMENRLRWFVRPVLQLLFAVLLHVTWILKRLPLPQFSAHRGLQRTICWFCRHLVSPEANQLILRPRTSTVTPSTASTSISPSQSASAGWWVIHHSSRWPTTSIRSTS